MNFVFAEGIAYGPEVATKAQTDAKAAIDSGGSLRFPLSPPGERVFFLPHFVIIRSHSPAGRPDVCDY